MPVANNLFTAAILAPLVTVLSAISLSTLQRAIEWVSTIANNHQKGTLKKLRPYAKTLDTIIERIFSGNEFKVTTTNILLMAVVIVLICMVLENAQKPKKYVVREKVKGDEAKTVKSE